MIAPVRAAIDELRGRARRTLGIERIHERIDQIEGQLRALEPGGWERSRVRWRGVSPNAGLTWGRHVSGDAFVAKLVGYHALRLETRILEIGPGYGRLPQACLRLGVEFREYLGVDISPANVEHLRRTFSDPRLRFVVADAEELDLPGRYDLLISSLVFKHLYPSFEAVLTASAAHLSAGALVCFDLIEGDLRQFEYDRVTYIRCYTREEVLEILKRAGLKLVEFTTVQHDETHERLLTVASKTAPDSSASDLVPSVR
jgi:SAM-dependent methyltransferase